MNHQGTDAEAGPSRGSDNSLPGWRSTTSSFASNSIHLDPMQNTKYPLNAITSSAPINSPLFDCVNIHPSSNGTPQSALSSSTGYFQPGSSNPAILRTKVEKDLPDLPPSEDNFVGDLSGSHEALGDAYSDTVGNHVPHSDNFRTTHSPVLSNVHDVQSVSSNGLFNRLSPSWTSAVKTKGKNQKEPLSGFRKPGSRNGTSPGRGREESTLVGLGVDGGRLGRGSNTSVVDTSTGVPHGDPAYNAWSNRAAAVKAAGQTAGVGLKKWGKASAAKIKQAQQRQMSGKEGGSPTIGNWGRMGTANLSNFRGRAAKSSADLPMTSSEFDKMSTFPTSASPSPSIQPDPRIGLPTDVRHNVHVDIGPQGYTGLPASWAQVLAQYGMDVNEVRKDPAGAIALIRQRTQYYVDKEAELGQDPENTKRLLESRLGQLEELQDARDAVRSVTPGPRASQHYRRSSDNATKSDATLRRYSNASTTYSSVLNQGWPPSPSWSDAPSLPQIPSQHISPSLPQVQGDDSDDDWGANLLKSLPKSHSEDKQLNHKANDVDQARKIDFKDEHYGDNIEALAYDAEEIDASKPRDYNTDEMNQAEFHRNGTDNVDDETGSILTASRIPTAKVVRTPQLLAQSDQDKAIRIDSAPSEQSSRGTFDTHINARFASPEAHDSSCTSHSLQSSLDDSFSLMNDARTSDLMTTVAKASADVIGQSNSNSSFGIESQPASSSSRISSGERQTSTQNEISKHVSEGLRERRKNATRIYPPSSNKFVGQTDVPSPRSVGFKPALSVRTSGTSQSGGKSSSLTTISNGSDASLGQSNSVGTHFLAHSPSQSPAISLRESHSFSLGDASALPSLENETKSNSIAMRNSGASVRLASQPLQMHFDTRRKESNETDSDQPPALPYKQARVSPGQSTPDFIHPDADGFFRPSSSSAHSAGHSSGILHGQETDRNHVPIELQPPKIIKNDGLLLPEVNPTNISGQSEEEISNQYLANAASKDGTDNETVSNSTQRLSVDQRTHSTSSTPSDSNIGMSDDYQPASDFLDDWLNDEDDCDPSPGYGHSHSTGSDRAQSPFYEHQAIPQSSLSVSLQRNEPDAHQSPSPALLKGLPTPLRAQFDTSLQVQQKDSDDHRLTPLSQMHSMGHSIDVGKGSRDWRVRSLPPPPPDEDNVEDKHSGYLVKELGYSDKGMIGMEKGRDQSADDRMSIVSLPLHDFDPTDGENGPPKADAEAQESAALTRPSSRQSRSSSRTGSRHLRRRSSDARRFPISMHYSSGFDTDAFGTDSEAISSFADLMRARQSMDLDEVMPMRLDSMMDVPPVPALPAALGKEQSNILDPVSMKKEPEIDLACPSHLISFIHPGDPQKIFENFKMIGEGESGDVFSAFPKEKCGIKSVDGLGVIAIKVVNMSSLQSDKSSETSGSKPIEEKKENHPRLQNLDKELSLWRKAAQHPNIINLFDVFLYRPSNSQVLETMKDGIWIVQECMSMSLADVIALKTEGLTFKEKHMARIFGDISAAMHNIHSKGIIHRDVRSDNVLLTSDGIAKLTDFTHATSLLPNEKRSSVVGTPYWMAPEVIKAELYDQKADIWSLAAVLYEMVEGVPPRVEFPALRAITLTVQLGLPALQDPQLYSTALKECLAWCSEVQPENRPSADMILEGEFIASAASYEEMHNLMIQGQAMEAGEGNSNDGNGQEEILVEGKPVAGSSSISNARDSWTSQSTVQG